MANNISKYHYMQSGIFNSSVFRRKKVSINSFSKLYRFLVVCILILIMVSQLIIHYVIGKERYDAHIINIASRQRTLSQNIVKTVLDIRLNLIQHKATSGESTELESLVDQFEKSHYALMDGSDSMDIDVNNSSEILALFRRLHPYFLVIDLEARTIAHQVTYQGGMDESLQHIMDNEQPFLQLMEKIVYTYNKENIQKTKDLQLVVIILAMITFFLIIIEIFWLYTPLMKGLQKRNKMLQIQYDRIHHFLYVLSHNIRRPVANLIGLAALMENMGESDKEMVDSIQKSALELDDMIKELNERLYVEDDED